MSDEKKEVGRPSKFKEAYIEQVRKLALAQFTNEEIADFFEINIDTFYEWKKVHKKFSEAIKMGRTADQSEIVRNMYKSASGYQVKEVKKEYESIEYNDDGTINDDLSIIKSVVITDKHVPANTGAGAFLLKNLSPEKWNKKPVEEKEEEFTKPKVLEQGKELPND